MNFDGIEIDMLFAKLALKEVPDSMVFNIFLITLFKNLHSFFFFYKHFSFTGS